MTYISDWVLISRPFGTYQVWRGKLFYWRCVELGWVYIKDLEK